ncbi:MAG: FAD-dependent oxidoreductase [Sediminibacterium sp.]|nr:FAD-dependent oxidoreductase [Sediminibacterium sp.]
MPKVNVRDNRVVNFSYWELKSFLAPADVIIVGGGIVGLSSAIFIKKRWPRRRVVVLERGVLPSGASTKNAGFACFGSAGEVLDDLTRMDEETVLSTIRLRWEGLQLLRGLIGDTCLDYKALGGYEVFQDRMAAETCLDALPYLNDLMREVTGNRVTYLKQPGVGAKMGFWGVGMVIKNRYEGQLDTGLMMNAFIHMAQGLGVQLLNGVVVDAILDLGSRVDLNTNVGCFSSKRVVVATNGFAAQLLNLKTVQPARAQVLVTEPIKGLKLKGAFHFDQGYYYFRNIDGRVLLGGGRNLDFKGETTYSMETTLPIQKALDKLLKGVIVPYAKVKVAHRWAGIMGVGPEKKPIVEPVSANVIAAVRMGGMGVAIGSRVGQIVARLVGE